MRRLFSVGLGAVVGCASASETAPPAVDPAPAVVDPAASVEATAVAPPPVRATSVKPANNDAWKSDDVDPLIARLESESREIWVHRQRLLEVVAPRPGSVVADIGAGSGFMTLLFARAVGPSGKVVAVDLNPKLLEQIAARARAEDLDNVQTLRTPEDAIPLAPASVDLVFLCDAYHHFEYPESTMRSIHAALREGGELVLVDFERIPGKTEPAMLEHVRAGKEVFRQEILDAGFELVREHEVPEFEENYVLRFRKAPRR